MPDYIDTKNQMYCSKKCAGKTPVEVIEPLAWWLRGEWFDKETWKLALDDHCSVCEKGLRSPNNRPADELFPPNPFRTPDEETILQIQRMDALQLQRMWDTTEQPTWRQLALPEMQRRNLRTQPLTGKRVYLTGGGSGRLYENQRRAFLSMGIEWHPGGVIAIGSKRFHLEVDEADLPRVKKVAGISVRKQKKWDN